MQLEQWVQGDLQPNLTLLFDLPLAIAAQRLAQGRAQLDKFEQESQVFFENTRAAYLERAADAPNRICIIDSAQSLEATRAQVAHAVLSQLNLNLTAYL